MKLGLVDTQVRMFGVDGGPTANGRAEVARQLESMGRWVEARVFWEQVVAAYRRNRGADDLMTVQSEEFLALNLAKSGLHQDAINLMDHVVAVYRQALGPDHEETTRAIRFRERIKALDSE